MKIIIVGAGKVGFRIAKELSVENHEITIIDTEEEALKTISNKVDVLTMVGNGVEAETLKDAGVKNADFVMAVTTKDEANIICCLIAKKLGAKRTIARVRDPIYASQFDFLTSNLGINIPINPEKETAETIARCLRYPGAEQVEIINGNTEIVGIKIDLGSVLANKDFITISKELKIKVLACAIDRAGEIVIPHGTTQIEIGDIVYFTGARVSLYALMRKLGYDNHLSSTLIIGGGKIAHYLGLSLLENGFQVKIIDSKYEHCEKLADFLPKANVVFADYTNKQVLLEEGIDRVDSVITLSASDEVNIILSLFAKARGVGTIITKLSDGVIDEFTDMLNLGIVVSPGEIVAEELIKTTRALSSNNEESSIISLYKIIGDKVEAVTFKVGEDCALIGKTLREMQLKPGVIVSGVVRGKEYIIPDGNTIINKGDEVLVMSTKYKFLQISDILA